MFDLKTYIKERRDAVDEFLRQHFSVRFQPEILYESMTYSLFAGGKRLRPILAIASYETCGGEYRQILPQAAALELIHTYSLIHDDLPAMDNDDIRRGKPTNHRVFGEAMAILAGDALLTEAFYIFLNSEHFPPERLIEACRHLADAAGPRGMVGGQAEDILSEGRPPEPDTLFFIHTHKTGALISASVRIGAILADVPVHLRDALGVFGDKIGLAFQIADDILDVTGEEERMGKKKGSDQRKGKMTYPSLYGIDRSRAAAEELVREAVGALRVFGESATPLVSIAQYIIQRVE